MNERVMILRSQEKYNVASPGIPGVITTVFNAIDKRYESLISWLFKWTS
jgi:hypothetical protein